MTESQLIIIGGGVVEANSDGYRARSQIVEYLTGFLRYYTKVTWATTAALSQDYTTRIEDVDVDVINQSLVTSIYSCKGMADQCRHYKSFATKIRRGTDVIVANVSLTSIPYVLLTKAFGGKLLLYMGSDPVLSFKLKKSYLSKIPPAINLILLPLVVFLADVVFVRGEATLRFCRIWNPHSCLSNPIISYGAFKEIGERGLIENVVRLLYVGKVDENKGVQILVDAFITIREKSRVGRVTLDIVGNGPQLELLRQKVHSLGIEHDVLFYGFVDNATELAQTFLRADLLVVPSVTAEGFPRVIDEAFTTGVPVVCSKIGGMKYLDGQEGVCLVEPGDYDDLTVVLDRFVNDENWREKMKLAAQLRAKNYLRVPASKQHAMAMLR